MALKYAFPLLVGRAVRAIMRARGGGSALPGNIVNRLAPGFLPSIADQLPGGVVFVLGSNGKSTTTHMVSELLRAHGLRVFTNPTGANLPQGVTSALLPDLSLGGRLDADVAVLEIDEAFAVELANMLRPDVVLMLNVQVDQLYRFYETERVADMMLDTGELATRTVITNRDDPYLSKMGRRLDGPLPTIEYFGVADDVLAASANGLNNAIDTRDPDTVVDAELSAEVTAWRGATTTVALAGAGELEIALPARGLHYAIDAAAALQTARAVLGERFDGAVAVRAFEVMKPAYGRGEFLRLGDEEVEITMFKNGPSLQLNLDAFDEPPEQVMMAIDEGTPDMSWIYDVDVSGLDHVDVLSGEKCWQLALRFEHAGVPVHRIEPDLATAIEVMRGLGRPSRGRKAWIVNYELMMDARRIVGQGDMEVAR